MCSESYDEVLNVRTLCRTRYQWLRLKFYVVDLYCVEIQYTESKVYDLYHLI